MKPDTVEPVEPARGSHAQFPGTRWSVVLAATDPSGPVFHDAINRLCQTYWFPIYAFARRSGQSPHDAADLTQSFFGLLLEKERFRSVDRSKGKFRSFLLASFKNFLHNERDRAQAQKRGGRHELISLDAESAEERYQPGIADKMSAEQHYDREWAVVLTREVVQELRADYARHGKEHLFKAMEPYLTREIPDGELSDIATCLGRNHNTLKSDLRRLRQGFIARLRKKACQTLADPSEQEIREEIRYLFAAIAV